MNNKDYTKKIIENNKTKFLFIGFIIGIIPFIIFISIISIYEGGLSFVPSIFRNTIIIAGIITAFLNAILIQKILINKLSQN